MREGIIPAILGTAVTATGATIRGKHPVVGWGVMGFGLAHVLLGAIDLVEHRHHNRF
ncbi:asparagine synthase [Paenibacillus psychroresistens]|uniref:Asparagine synthase n=1 Tax=Paenibacillus psychroresistens TaxID=1778678 RepID=A0A6B8RQ69_9BACL|nr:asparagine synthase [Paenibacillus psychroresistens]QGQ97842.1 asparagine synthase [Paenibacillus psychroresistens]